MAKTQVNSSVHELAELLKATATGNGVMCSELGTVDIGNMTGETNRGWWFQASAIGSGGPVKTVVTVEVDPGF